MTAGPIVVGVKSDSSALVSDLGKSEGRLHKFGKVAKFAALGVAGALGGAAAVAVKLAKGAAEDQQAAALMARQFKASAGATDQQVASTEKWITKQGIAKGVADDELRPALSKLVVATHSVSGSQKLASLAMDISAATGKDLTTVSAALAKGYNGQVGGLGRLGIATKDAQGKTKSFTQIQGDLTKQFGGAATTKAGTLSGMMARLKVTVSEAGESLGYKLLPLATKVGTWFVTQGVPAITKFGKAAGDFLRPILAGVGQVIAGLLPLVKSVGSYIIAQIPTVQAFAAEVGQKLKPVFDQLVTTFKTQVLPTLIQMQPTVQQIVSKVGTFVAIAIKLQVAIASKVLPVVIKLAGFLFAHVVPAVLKTTLVIVKVISTVASLVVGFGKAVGAVTSFAGKVVAGIAGIPGRVSNAVTALVGKGRDLITGFIRGLVGKFGDVATSLRSHIGNLSPSNAGTALIDVGKDLVRGLINGVGKMVGALKDKVASLVGDAIKAAKDKFKIFSPSRVFHDIGGNVGQGLINGLDSKRASVVSTMDKISSDLITAGSSTTLGAPTAKRTTVATTVPGGGGGLTIQVTLNVPVGASGADVGRELVEFIEDYYAVGGRRLP